MSDSAIRLIRILQLLPDERWGGISVSTIIDRLEHEYGITSSTRMVQRDLLVLSDSEKGGFPIDRDEDLRTPLWYWYGRDAISIPTMGRHTALTFRLAKQLLTPLLPAVSLEYLTPSFDTAEKVLEKRGERQTRKWINKIRVVPRGIRQNKACIRDGVMETVSQALYDDKQIEITYRATSSRSRKYKTYSVTPYALLYRHTVTELVGRIEPDEEIRRWAMHRIKDASVLDSRAVIPRGFNLDDYVERNLAYPFSGDKITLKAWFREDAINHVMETKLSSDQVIKHVKDGVNVTATVRETVELKWWLLGLGERVKVIGPKGLRENIKNTILGMAENYK